MGFFNFKQKKDQLIQKDENFIYEESKKFNIEIYREKFFVKIQPFYDAGLLREIYRCDHFSVYAFGERVYIACPYIMLDEIPYGVYMNPSVLRKIIRTNRKIYPIINEVFGDIELNKDLIFMLQEDKVQWWKQWLAENKNVNKIDKDLEQEIKHVF